MVKRESGNLEVVSLLETLKSWNARSIDVARLPARVNLAVMHACRASEKISAVPARFLFVCGALLLSASGAFADGEYQRTKNGKTIVWNNDPKPGDAAAWFGDRDSDGYATKAGTLTWYTANSAVYARYFGNMVRGKFNGMVNVHSKGKTEHAIFVDGQRTTRWATGPAPSSRVAHSQAGWPAKLAAATKAPAEGRRVVHAESAQPASRPPNDTAQKAPNFQSLREQAAQGPIENAPANELSLQRAPPAKPAGTPEPAPAEPSGAAEPEGPRMVHAESGQPASRPPNDTARQAPSSESFPERATQPPIENAPASELSLQQAPPAKAAGTPEPAPAEPSRLAEPEAPAEGPRAVHTESAQPATGPPNDTVREAPSSESFPEGATPPAIEDAPSVSIEPSKESVSTPPTSKKSQVEVENSLQSFVQPPSSLLAIPETAGSPEASPRLTKEQVVRIANASARTHGYNRADYERAEPQYNAAYKIWSVSYDQIAADGVGEAGKHFNVIVDDKTKGTVFVLRR